MSKAVKTVVSVVAAIAVPFVAPAIAASIGVSSAVGAALGSATAGSVIGGALTGAVLGGVTQAALGGDFKRGALMGAIGGGIAGYSSAPSTSALRSYSASPGSQYSLVSPGSQYSLAQTSPYTIGNVTAPATTGPGLSMPATFGGTEAGLSLPATFGGAETNFVGAMSPSTFTGADYSLASGAQFPSVGLNPTTAGVGLRMPDPGFFDAGVANALETGTPIDYSLTAYSPPSTGLRTVMENPITGGTQVVTSQGVYQSTSPITHYSNGVYVGPTGTATSDAITAGMSTGAAQSAGAVSKAGAAMSTKPTTFTEALSQVPAEIAKKFTNPETLADLTLRAAGNLAGSAIAGDGLTGEERVLLDAQTEELRKLQQTNAGLFAQRLEQAMNLIGESKYFDPEYFGLQHARRAQTAAARAKRAGLRGLEGARRAAESRRFDLAMTRDVGTAYDQGYLQGLSGRLSTLQTGVSMLPTSYPSSMGEYTNLRMAYGDAAERARKRANDIGALFGSLTGRS